MRVLDSIFVASVSIILCYLTAITRQGGIRRLSGLSFILCVLAAHKDKWLVCVSPQMLPSILKKLCRRNEYPLRKKSVSESVSWI